MTNPLTTFLAKKRTKSSNLETACYGFYLLSDKISLQTLNHCLQFFSAKETTIRNSAIYCATKVFANLSTEQQKEFLEGIITRFENLTLLEKLGILELFKRANTLEITRKFLVRLLPAVEHDLLFQVIQALPQDLPENTLDTLLKISTTTRDRVLVLMALRKWEQSLEGMEEKSLLNYCTPRIHSLIRVFELWGEGQDILFKVLDRANPEQLPEGQLYPDTTVRAIIAFLEKYEYSPTAYQNAYRIIIPQYFALA